MRFEVLSMSARDSREPPQPGGGNRERVSKIPGTEWVSDWSDDPPPYLPNETVEEVERNIRGA